MKRKSICLALVCLLIAVSIPWPAGALAEDVQLTGAWILQSLRPADAARGEALDGAALELAGFSLRMELDEGGAAWLNTDKSSWELRYERSGDEVRTSLGTLRLEDGLLKGEMTLYGMPFEVVFAPEAAETTVATEAATAQDAPEAHDQPAGAQTKVTCPYCHGLGWTVCPECGGEGGIACLQCYGRGSYRGETCDLCDGSGIIACGTCGYTGVSDMCPYCDGHGFTWE